jgi:hypothetical protein
MDTFDALNTRRYPRTLNEAFPSGPAYGCALTRPETRGEKLAGIGLAVFIGVCLAGALIQWWST